MIIIISLALALLTIVAGLFLLNESKQGLGIFFKIMSWIIISFGILLVLFSIQCAVFNCIHHKHHQLFMKTHGMFFHHRNLMGRFDQFETLNWSHHPFGKNEGTEPDSMRTKTDDENFNPDVQSQAIIKIFNDNNVKLTPDQEKAIKPAIGDFLKASRNFRHNRKDKEVKESK